MGYTDGNNTTMLVEPAYRNGGGSNGMFGDNNGAWWIIILFLFIFCGWGGNRNGIDGNGGRRDGRLRSDLRFRDDRAQA